MEYTVTILGSFLTKTSKNYPCIKIKCKKDNGRIVYSDYFFSKKSKNFTKFEVLELLKDFGVKINRKIFITPRYLNKKINKLNNKKALCNVSYVYRNLYKRELFNLENLDIAVK